MRKTAVAVVMTMAMNAVACGNRVSEDEVQKLLGPASGSSPAVSGATQAEATAPVEGVPESPSTSPASPGSVGSTVPSKAPLASAADLGASTRAAGTGRSVPATKEASPRSIAEPSNPGAGTSLGGGALPPDGADEKSVVVLASVGTYSGPLGVVTVPVLRAAQAWVQLINDKGGLNRHPIHLLVYDDGGDSARHGAQIKEAIEQRRAIAFLQNAETITGRPSVKYITDKRVPVIGGVLGEDWFYDSPMYFPQGTSGKQLWRLQASGIAQETVPRGKTKLGTLFCVEVGPCDEADRIVAEEAAGVGFQHVYRGKTSLTQPDYTAECLAARNAGAQVVLMGLDPQSQVRIANSCARQGYRPIFSVPATAAPSKKVVNDTPNLEGYVTVSSVFPFLQSGTAPTDEFHQAMRTYAPKEEIGISAAVGWVSGKLLEKAAVNLPEPPTAEALLQGLWALREDTLGGLTGPLTFVAEQPAIRMTCGWIMVVKNQVWTSPDGFRRFCR